MLRRIRARIISRRGIKPCHRTFIKCTEMFSTTTPLILRRKAITKPKAKRQKRQRTSSEQSQSEADNSDSNPIPLEALSVNEPIAHQKSEEVFVQSTIFQSNSWSERNESIRNKSITRRNQFLTRRRTKQSTVKRNTTVSSSHSSVRVSEASHWNERVAHQGCGRPLNSAGRRRQYQP